MRQPAITLSWQQRRDVEGWLAMEPAVTTLEDAIQFLNEGAVCRTNTDGYAVMYLSDGTRRRVQLPGEAPAMTAVFLACISKALGLEPSKGAAKNWLADQPNRDEIVASLTARTAEQQQGSPGAISDSPPRQATGTE